MRVFKTRQSYRDVASLWNALTLLLYRLATGTREGLLGRIERPGTSRTSSRLVPQHTTPQLLRLSTSEYAVVYIKLAEEARSCQT
jgi:hypothetical protein